MKFSMVFHKFNLAETTQWGFSSSVHADFGCGYNPRNPFNAKKVYGLDVIPDINRSDSEDFGYIKLELGQKTPLSDESVDSISGYDFLEHLGRGDGSRDNYFIEFMSEASRLLRPGGILFLVTPAFPSAAAFQDPTHVNFITDETVKYFVGHPAPAESMGYGFYGSFDLVSQFWAGPFSKIFRSDLTRVDSNKTQLLRNAVRIRAIRRTISSIRNPTHLVWLLRKV